MVIIGGGGKIELVDLKVDELKKEVVETVKAVKNKAEFEEMLDFISSLLVKRVERHDTVTEREIDNLVQKLGGELPGGYKPDLLTMGKSWENASPRKGSSDTFIGDGTSKVDDIKVKEEPPSFNFSTLRTQIANLSNTKDKINGYISQIDILEVEKGEIKFNMARELNYIGVGKEIEVCIKTLDMDRILKLVFDMPECTLKRRVYEAVEIIKRGKQTD